jgi:hypothetical protein
MSHEVIASLRVPLPDAPEDMARMLGVVASAWAELIGKVGDSGRQTPDTTFSVNETRAKRAARKPRLVTPPEQAA